MNNSTDELPENIKRRLDLFKMFYPLERKYERRWAEVFNSTFTELLKNSKKDPSKRITAGDAAGEWKCKSPQSPFFKGGRESSPP